MAVLLIDLHALAATDPAIQDLAADWLHKGHSVVYLYDANAAPPAPPLIPADKGVTLVPCAGEGDRYLDLGIQWCLDLMRRPAFAPSPPLGKEGGVRPCVLATAPGRYPRAKALPRGLLPLYRTT